MLSCYFFISKLQNIFLEKQLVSDDAPYLSSLPRKGLLFREVLHTKHILVMCTTYWFCLSLWR